MFGQKKASSEELEAVNRLTRLRKDAEEKTEAARRQVKELEAKLAKLTEKYDRCDVDLMMEEGKRKEGERTIAKMKMENVVFMKMVDQLKQKMKYDAAHANATTFLGWSTKRPKAEWFCASMLLHEMSTVQFPVGSTVTLPPLEAFNGVELTLCDLPNNALIRLPSSGVKGSSSQFVGTTGKVVHFPEAVAINPDGGLIQVPGGSVITVPEDFDGVVHVPVGTIVTAPEIGPSTKDVESGQSREVLAPEAADGELIPWEVPMGTTLVLPLGPFHSARVPSGCTFGLITGSNSIFSVPEGSVARLSDNSANGKGSHLCMLPPDTVIDTSECSLSKKGLKPGGTQGSFRVDSPADSTDSPSKLGAAPGAWGSSGDVATMMLPGGCVIECAAGEIYVPTHTEYKHPDDLDNILSAEAGIPFHADVQDGTVVNLPKPKLHTPKMLAQAMHELGPRFAGLAIGVLPLDVVARGFVNAAEAGVIPDLDASIGRMLVMARPARAAALLKLLDQSLASRFLVKMTSGVAGAILFHMDESMVEQVLSFAIGDDERCKRIEAGIKAYGVAKDLFVSSIGEDVDASKIAAESAAEAAEAEAAAANDPMEKEKKAADTAMNVAALLGGGLGGKGSAQGADQAHNKVNAAMKADVAKTLSASNGREKEMERVNALIQLEPFVAAQLVSLASAPMVSNTLSKLAETRRPQCTAIVEVLGELALLMQVSCKSHKEADVEAVGLLQTVASCDTEVEMHGAVTSLLKFYKEKYGFTATLARMPETDYRDALDKAASAVTPGASSPTAFGGAGAGAATSEGGASSPVPLETATSMESNFSLEMADEMKASPEERALDTLQVVFTTEEVIWGAGSNQDSSGFRAGRGASNSFAVHMQARSLIDAQFAVEKTGRLTLTENMVMEPIEDAKGNTIFTLSSLHKNLFSKLDRSDDISLDKVLPMSNDLRAAYWLKITGAAMRTATDLIAAKRAAALAGSFKGNASKRDMLELQITAAAELKNKIIHELMNRSQEVRGQMSEIRAYKKPPGKTSQIVVALLILLGEEGLEDHLGPQLTDFPEDGSKPAIKLWNFARSRIQVSQRHPDYVLRRMVNMSKGMVISTEGGAMKHVDAAKAILSAVSEEAAARSTYTLLNLFNWESSCISQFDLQVKLQKMVEEEMRQPSRKKRLAAGASVKSSKGLGGRGGKNNKLSLQPLTEEL